MSANAALALDSESAIAEMIAAAAEAREPVWVHGHGTKAPMLRPVQAARSLSTTGLTGITLYSPKELIISARAGTPLPEIEAALSAQGQHLIAEPPDLMRLFGTVGTQSVGGVMATNLSGPRRVAWGAVRDHVLGVRAVNGAGELIRSGGRVLKNVTGLDLCKLLTGSHGTLAVITEVTLKVLPAPETTGTVVVCGLDATHGVAALSAGLGSPYGVSAAAWLPDASAVAGLNGMSGSATLLRIEDFTASVGYRTDRLRGELARFGPGEILADTVSRAVWRAIRDAEPLRTQPGQAVWRVSLRPSAGPAALRVATDAGLHGYLDWGGGLLWLAGPAEVAAHRVVENAARAARGVWMLMCAPDALRAAVHVVPPEPVALARITQQVKAAFDPGGILNHGRLYAGL
jgi:glycolate oxidase FAD binding subunit